MGLKKMSGKVSALKQMLIKLKHEIIEKKLARCASDW